MKTLCLALSAALLCFTTACHPWQTNVTVHGVTFQKARIDEHGFIIGYLDDDETIAGRPCRAGWVHLHPNGAVAGFTAATDIPFPRFTIPSNTCPPSSSKPEPVSI